MKNILWFVLLCALLSVPLLAQSGTNGADIRIFAINLSKSNADVQLGSPAVFQAQGLTPNAVTRMSRIKTPGQFQIYFRTATGKVQLSPRNAGGQPYLYTIASGKNYLIRILSDTSADFWELTEPDKTSPVQTALQVAKICFINNSGAALPLIQVASAWNQNVLVSLKDLANREQSNFGSVNYPGEYSCFWAPANLAKDAAAPGLVDTSGKPILTKFSESSYWALIITPEPGRTTPIGTLVNITPN